MLTQIVLLKDATLTPDALGLPGVSEVHRIADSAAYGAVVILRGPDTDFLAKTLTRLNVKDAVVLPVETSQAALDLKYLP